MDTSRLGDIEWENVLLPRSAARKRCCGSSSRRFVNFVRHWDAIDRSFPLQTAAREILVLITATIDGHLVESIVTALVPQSDPDFELRIMPAHGGCTTTS